MFCMVYLTFLNGADLLACTYTLPDDSASSHKQVCTLDVTDKLQRPGKTSRMAYMCTSLISVLRPNFWPYISTPKR